MCHRKGRETHSERVRKDCGRRCASPYSGGEKTRTRTMKCNSQGYFRHFTFQPIIGPKTPHTFHSHHTFFLPQTTQWQM